MPAQVYSAPRTRIYLRDRLSHGQLASQHAAYIDEQIRHPSAIDTFYNRIKAEQGTEAAETKLAEWNAHFRLPDFAAAFEPVARGMLALSTADCSLTAEDRYRGDLVKLIDVGPGTSLPGLPATWYPIGKLLIAANRPTPGRNYNPLKGSEIYGPPDFYGANGSLGIKAVAIHFGLDHEATALYVYLPVRTLYHLDAERRRTSFTVVKIKRNGHTNVKNVCPDVPDLDLMLKYLGLADGRMPPLEELTPSEFDDAVGFPGAMDYLADKLPGLEHYFASLAEKFDPSKAHSHH
jgi:hypothetical protein